jgi:uncharacterized membrane protein YhaH (DUF805 family)
VNWYIAVLKNYVGFSGRARRQEYWMFALFDFIIFAVLYVIGLAIKTEIPYLIYGLAVLLPGLAVAFRRLHDTGKTAWWLLIGIIPFVGGIVLLVFMCLEGTQGDNQYGPDPKRIPVGNHGF